MALLGNYNLFNKNPIQNTGGDSTSGIVGLRANWNQNGISNNRFYGETQVVGVADRYGIPGGYSIPYAWKLPMKSGGVGSNVGLKGVGDIAASGALGINLSATFEGTGTISDANLALILSAVATLSGIGGLSADVVGTLQATATLAGAGDISGSLGALAGAVATLTGTGTITGGVIAKGNVSASIFVNESQASVAQIAEGVWSTVAADFNASGTMGQKLNGAGSAGDPWTTDLDTYTTPGTAGKILKDAKNKATLAASLSA
jgi:hypothetical protein